MLALNLDHLAIELGYEHGFSNIEECSLEDRFGILRRHFDYVDFDEIRRSQTCGP